MSQPLHPDFVPQSSVYWNITYLGAYKDRVDIHLMTPTQENYHPTNPRVVMVNGDRQAVATLGGPNKWDDAMYRMKLNHSDLHNIKTLINGALDLLNP